MRIAFNAYDGYGGRFFHNDTTTMSIQGEYEHEEGDLDAAPIKITHRFSKDGRPRRKKVAGGEDLRTGIYSDFFL